MSQPILVLRPHHHHRQRHRHRHHRRRMIKLVFVRFVLKIINTNKRALIFNFFFFFFFVAQLKGSINDCSCTVDTVDYFNNNKIYPRLRSLLVKDYFRFYKINLYKQCPYWDDDSKCSMRFCSVSTCDDKDVPVGLKGLEHGLESAYEKVSHKLISVCVCVRNARLAIDSQRQLYQ